MFYVCMSLCTLYNPIDPCLPRPGPACLLSLAFPRTWTWLRDLEGDALSCFVGLIRHVSFAAVAGALETASAGSGLPD
jgi:hypothetical protein